MKAGAFPKIERISQWGSGTEIIYQCPRCETSFGVYGDKEKFCHFCGQRICWTGLPKSCSKEFSLQYHGEPEYSKKKAMVSRLEQEIFRI